MFKCEADGCGRTTDPRETMTRVVRSTRPRNYYYRPEANRDGQDDPGGEGTEVVSEIRVCETCAGVDRDKGRVMTEAHAIAAIRLREQLAEEARIAEFKKREKNGANMLKTVAALTALANLGAQAIPEKGRKKRERRAS